MAEGSCSALLRLGFPSASKHRTASPSLPFRRLDARSPIRPSSRNPVIRCCAEGSRSRSSSSSPSSSSSSSPSPSSAASAADERANIILKAAWYGAEALGNIVSVFSPKDPAASDADADADAASDASLQGPLSRDFVIQAIKDDYEKGYFVTGNVSGTVYEEDCEFADPAGSFKSLKRFKNNCSNFGSLLEKSDVKLVKWEELNEKFVAYWRFSCILKFPWRPILSSTGFTEYYFNEDSGRICRHAENWDVPKMALLAQVFKPNPTFRRT